MMLRGWAAWTLAAVVGVGGVGCNALRNERFVEPQIDIRDSSVVVLPFAEGRMWYFESAAGARFSRLFAYRLQRECGVALRADSAIDKEIQQSLDDPPPWSEWGERLGADYLVLGTIKRLEFTDDKVIGMVQGSMVVEVMVWDVEANAPLDVPVRASGRFPEDPEEGGAFMEHSEEELQQTLFAKTAEKLVEVFCGYKENFARPKN